VGAKMMKIWIVGTFKENIGQPPDIGGVFNTEEKALTFSRKASLLLKKKKMESEFTLYINEYEVQ
jgi:hypothetical protein